MSDAGEMMASGFFFSADTNRRDFFQRVCRTIAGAGLVLLGSPKLVVAALKVGDPLPPVTLKDLRGRKVSLPGDFRGQVGLIHFWASWCPYCVKEFKAIEALYQLYKTRGFLPYSINVGDTPVAAEAYIAPLGISYPIPLDGGSSVARLYGITGIPTTLLVDRTGLIRHKILGEINQDGLKKLVSFMLV